MPSRKKLKVSLVFGGTSQERQVSIESAKQVYKYLNKQKYDVRKIEVTKNPQWIAKNLKALLGSDVAFLALHGPGGEDGSVQAILDILNVPYTCSGALASAMAMDKAKTKRLAASEGISVAPHLLVSRHDYHRLDKYLKDLKGKFVIKPNRIGSSLGVTIVKTSTEMKKGIEQAFQHDTHVLVEPFIEGRELTVPVLGNLDPAALPVIEIVPKISKFFDYRAKYETGGSDEIVPAPISKSLAKKLQDIAVEVHKLLGCRGMTRSDFIVAPTGQIYFLEINTIPGLTENSLVPKSARAAGLSYSELLDELIRLALDKTA